MYRKRIVGDDGCPGRHTVQQEPFEEENFCEFQAKLEGVASFGGDTSE